MSLPGRSARIGVAVAPGALAGVLLGSAARPERVDMPGGAEPAGKSHGDGVVGGVAAGGPEEVAGGEDVGMGTGTRLVAAFRQLRARMEATHGRSLEGAEVSLALLPPLADVRLLSLPPLRRREAEAVVRRDAARHFIGVEAPRVVGVTRLRKRRGGPGPVLAAAVGANLLEAVRRGAEGAGWRVASVAPAQAAWLTAAPGGKRAPGLVVAVEGGTAHVVRMEGEDTVSLRKVPLALPGELAAATEEGDGVAVVFGETAAVGAVVEVVERAGWSVPSGGEGRPSAAEAAARYARDAALELVPPSLAAERAGRARGRAWRMVALAAVLVAAAGIVHLWGARRQLEAVRAGRAEIRDEVTPLVAARDSLAVLSTRMEAIEEITSRAPRWTRVLYELALLLPRDAHLTSLMARGESLEIEAEARRAGAAVEALRGAESLRNVELLGLVERELEEGETVMERFRLGAVLAPPGDPPATDPVGTGTGPGVESSTGGGSAGPTVPDPSDPGEGSS